LAAMSNSLLILPITLKRSSNALLSASMMFAGHMTLQQNGKALVLQFTKFRTSDNN